MDAIPDAYQEYIAERREKSEAVKIATLTLPASDLAAVWKLVAGAVDEAEELPADARRKWDSILNSMARSVHEAA